MNIEDFMSPPEDDEVVIKSKIRQRRSQMLVHSCAYYEFDTSLVDDDTWQKWANELSELQDKYPQFCHINFFDKEFQNWTGDTGYHLPLRDTYVYNKTMYIMKIWDKHD